MKKYIRLILVCLVVVLGSYCLAPANAAAENKLDWTTTDLHYVLNSEGYPTDVVIIEGYFTNNTDKYINYIYEFDLTATIRADIGAGYKDQVHGNFKNFEKIIEPYSTSDHRFRINKAKIIWPIEEYEVIQGVTKWKYSNAAG
ncbi:hypothetical protein SPSIL_041450 [Sporomusa silvacetica DSM 10669]|uniref:Uncharacterized protein n=1 Tax=Sporomusa silvacetica DSM 10669 TaxID=1123289 RepID=A0ABZ3IQI1_9FIRM|nr:hypothetical protein [Sporomusa silvacetica]OZC20407.1 hypothetical protein SPSIL_12740 [Sporomusa silvacetica DSM 10669]